MKLLEVKFYCFIIVGERARVVELKKRNEKWRKCAQDGQKDVKRKKNVKIIEAV
jgi:hypothetical protein